MGKLVLGGPAGEGWTLGPGGRTAQPDWGQRLDTAWAWHQNQAEEPADAVNPEHRQTSVNQQTGLNSQEHSRNLKA